MRECYFPNNVVPGATDIRRKKLFLRFGGDSGETGVWEIERPILLCFIAIPGHSTLPPPVSFPSISGMETAAELYLFIL